MNGRRLKDFSSSELFCGDVLDSMFCVYYCYCWLNDTKNVESKEALPTLTKFHEVSWKLTETILASHVFPLGANYKVVPIHRLLEVMYVV